ncbi:hypothetical protein [Phyllobacterium sp. P5_D12]
MPVTPQVWDSQDTITVTWTAETGNGLAANVSEYPDKTVQRLAGTGTVTLEGSMDGTNWIGLKDASTAAPNTAISLATGTNTAAVVLEHTIFVRAVVAGGTATVMLVGTK